MLQFQYHPEDVGKMVLCGSGILPHLYTMSQPRTGIFQNLCSSWNLSFSTPK